MKPGTTYLTSLYPRADEFSPPQGYRLLATHPVVLCEKLFDGATQSIVERQTVHVLVVWEKTSL